MKVLSHFKISDKNNVLAMGEMEFTTPEELCRTMQLLTLDGSSIKFKMITEKRFNKLVEKLKKQEEITLEEEE